MSAGVAALGLSDAMSHYAAARTHTASEVEGAEVEGGVAASEVGRTGRRGSGKGMHVAHMAPLVSGVWAGTADAGRRTGW